MELFSIRIRRTFQLVSTLHKDKRGKRSTFFPEKERRNILHVRGKRAQSNRRL